MLPPANKHPTFRPLHQPLPTPQAAHQPPLLNTPPSHGPDPPSTTTRRRPPTTNPNPTVHHAHRSLHTRSPRSTPPHDRPTNHLSATNQSGARAQGTIRAASVVRSISRSASQSVIRPDMQGQPVGGATLIASGPAGQLQSSSVATCRRIHTDGATVARLCHGARSVEPFSAWGRQVDQTSSTAAAFVGWRVPNGILRAVGGARGGSSDAGFCAFVCVWGSAG